MNAKNRKLNAAIDRIEDLESQISNQDQCNLELVMNCIDLKDRVKELEKKVADAERKLKGVDALRHKVVADKAYLAEKYGKVCQIISEIDLDINKRYFCDRCKWSDGIVCTSEAPFCTFDVR